MVSFVLLEVLMAARLLGPTSLVVALDLALLAELRLPGG